MLVISFILLVLLTFIWLKLISIKQKQLISNLKEQDDKEILRNSSLMLKKLAIVFISFYFVFLIAIIVIYKTVNIAQQNVTANISMLENSNNEIVQEIGYKPLNPLDNFTDAQKKYIKNKEKIEQMKKENELLSELKYKLFLKH